MGLNIVWDIQEIQTDNPATFLSEYMTPAGQKKCICSKRTSMNAHIYDVFQLCTCVL